MLTGVQIAWRAIGVLFYVISLLLTLHFLVRSSRREIPVASRLLLDVRRSRGART